MVCRDAKQGQALAGYNGEDAHELRCDAPGSSRTKSCPLLKASGGQLIGSTASPSLLGARRLVSRCTAAAMASLPSQDIPTPPPQGSRTVNSRVWPPSSKPSPVKALSIFVARWGAGEEVEGVPAHRCGPYGQAPLRLGGEEVSASNSRVHSSSGAGQPAVGVRADAVGRGPVPPVACRHFGVQPVPIQPVAVMSRPRKGSPGWPERAGEHQRGLPSASAVQSPEAQPVQGAAAFGFVTGNRWLSPSKL